MIPFMIWGDPHGAFAVLQTVIFVFFGILLLLLWVPGYNPDDRSSYGITAKSRIKEGYFLLFLGLLSAIFGSFLMALMVAVLAIVVLFVLLNGLRVFS